VPGSTSVTWSSIISLALSDIQAPVCLLSSREPLLSGRTSIYWGG
jgi:hypothetical protein